MKRKIPLSAIYAVAAAAAALGTGNAAATDRQAPAAIAHGFHAQMTAKPGMGDRVVNLLLHAPALANNDCLVFLVGRSASDRDVVFVTEGWRSPASHRRFFESEIAQAYVARLTPLLDGESIYVDEVPVGGKAVLARGSGALQDN